ncbi:MAG TPA: hypothetical protein VGJ92_13200 [Methanocella sp.]|jgi:hypothetical protein
MRVIVACAIILAIIALLAVPPADALFDVGFMGGPVSLGIPYVSGPDFALLSPFAQGGYIMNEARTSTLANTFAGSLAIAFRQADGLDSGGFPIISPAIAQTTSQSTAASQSYFFNDFFTGV